MIHECREAYLSYFQCKHQVCGPHLLRDPAFVIESNGYRWARLIHKLLCEICHEVIKSETGVLNEAECRKNRKRYRTIQTQGGMEMPENPQRRAGKRGRVAKSFAHNLREHVLKHEDSILRFMSDPNVSFINNTGERRIRMSNIKGQNESLGVLPDKTRRTRLVPDVELSRFHVSTRIQSI